MKTVNIQVKWAAAHPGQDRRLPGCRDTLKAPSGRPASPSRGGDRPRRQLRGRYRQGPPASRTAPHGDGSMYSQAKREGRKGAGTLCPSVARPVIVDTEQVLREADGPLEM